jgi:hypothetical protein
MEPITIAVLAGVQLLQANQQAQEIRDNARFTKQIADMNAQFAELDAFKAEEQGFTMAARYQTGIDKVISDQRVVMAANDIDVNYGTAKAFEAESKLNGYLNQLDLRSQAHAQALGYKREARNLTFKGEQAITQGNINANATMTAGILNAATTGVKGYSEMQNSKAKLAKPTVSVASAPQSSEGYFSAGGYSTRSPNSYLGFEGN